jgi:branched-subunit amino acid transport protein
MDMYLHRGIAFSLSQKQSDVLIEIFRNANVMLCIQIVGFNLIANSAQIPAFLQDFLAYSPDPLLSTFDLSHLLGEKLFACPFVAGFCISVLQLALHQDEE